MVQYSNGIIYKLACKDVAITDVYVGSTTNFRRRKQGHKSKCCNENDKGHNIYVYTFIRSNGGWGNWDMIQIEEYSCENKRELHARERHWVEQLGAGLNKQTPARTQAEYQKQYREDNKDKIKQYNENNKDKRKLYYEANKDKILNNGKKTTKIKQRNTEGNIKKKIKIRLIKRGERGVELKRRN
jgi:hypothetical protein